jgi:hypothetical protein
MRKLRNSLRNVRSARRLSLILALSLIALIFAAGVGAHMGSAFFQDGNIRVTKTAPETAAADTNISYTITVATDGAEEIASAQLNDPLPSGTTFVSINTSGASAGWSCSDPGAGNNGTVTCNNATLAVGSNDVFVITVHIAADVAPGTFLTNVASVSGSPNENTEDDSFAATTQTPSNNTDLTLTKTGPSLSHNNSDVTYTITVTNPGPNTATNASFTDTLPNSVPVGFPMTFVSFTQDTGPTWNCSQGATTTCTLASLPPGTSTFSLVGHVPSGVPDGRTYTNQTTVTSAADPNSENNTSATTLTVLNCFTDQVVTTNADSGAGSLRQAVLDACDGSTITFDMTQVVSPINLASAISINKNLTIQGPGAGQLTISGNNTTRIFQMAFPVPNSLNVTIADLKLANSPDGAIDNNSTGTLTITNAIIANNSTLGGGGGINNNNAGAVNVTNSTFDHNSAQSGGGIYNSGGQINIFGSTFSFNSINNSGAGGGIFNNNGALTITNSTFSNNSTNPGTGAAILSDSTAVVDIVNTTISNNQANGNGGGIQTGANPVQLRNTIVAGNTATANGQDVIGTFTSNGHNLIGRYDAIFATGFTNGVNGDIVGTPGSPVDAHLGALANNGGTTQTLALLLGSPALDAGDNCVTDSAHCSDSNISQLTTDQRGFNRQIDGPDSGPTATVDIGAFEAQVSVEDLTDKTINEDTQLQFTFNIGGGANVSSVTASSSNTTLVPNLPANIALSGSASTRTLTINPVANLFGTSIITVTVNGSNGETMTDTFLLTVNAVPDTPSVTNATTSVNTQTTSGLVITKSANDGAEVTNYKITNITGGTLFKNNGTTQINNNNFITIAEGSQGLKFTPALNSNASGSFDVQASLSTNNSGLGGAVITATITVNCGSTVVSNSNDTGAGSLRTTILQACPGVTLTFDMSAGHVTSPINLTSAELVIDKSLGIQGPGANLLTVRRNAALQFRIFNVTLNSGGVTISRLTISNGSVSFDGGGISNSSNANLTLDSDVVTGNAAQFGGGVLSFGTGTVAILNSTINGNTATNSGGGIYSNGNANVNVINSTVTGNSAAAGGGVFNVQGQLKAVNATISNNSAPGGTGAGGGIYNNNVAPAAVLGNTIVAGNTAGTANGPDIQGTVSSLGNNLIGAKDGSSGLTNGVNSDIVGTSASPVSPLLSALGSYGGPTNTMALLPGSPAVNAGSNTLATNNGMTTDQRGFGFDRIVNTNVDIGAFESRGFTISVVSGTPQSTPILTPFAAPLVVSVVAVAPEPVDGGVILFTAPASGASATFAGGGTSKTGTISGFQTSIPLTANGTTGSYNVVASSPGAASKSFALTNTKGSTATAVASSVNPSDFGQNVTFTATVTGAAIPTGTVQFKDNGNNLGSPVTLNASGVAQFSTSSLTPNTHTITAVYSGDANFLTSTGTLSGGQLVLFRPLIKFSQPTYSVNEGGNFITITVVRSGDTSLPVAVNYTTPDDSAAMTFVPCSTANGVASPRCDFTTAIGTLSFAPGETSKTFNVLISQDGWVEGNENATLTLTILTPGAAFQQPSDANATLTIVDDDLIQSPINPIDTTDVFVRQQYHDFLNREADAPGLAFWKDNIDKCTDPTRRPPNQTAAQCTEIQRINTSAAFFLSIEFQNTGYFVERMYKAGFGDIAPPSVPVPIRFSNFIIDTQEIGRGIVVGQGNWQAQLDTNKKAFALAFVQRPAFVSRYPAATSPTAFVDALNANAGMVLTDGERAALVAELNPNPSDPALRADVLTKVTENSTLFQREFNRAFVLMQYFGYLRRNPDAAPEPTLNFNGYNFWLGKLNAANGDYIGAEMIKGFLNSGEYRGRFGQ